MNNFFSTSIDNPINASGINGRKYLRCATEKSVGNNIMIKII